MQHVCNTVSTQAITQFVFAITQITLKMLTIQNHTTPFLVNQRSAKPTSEKPSQTEYLSNPNAFFALEH